MKQLITSRNIIKTLTASGKKFNQDVEWWAIYGLLLLMGLKLITLAVFVLKHL